MAAERMSSIERMIGKATEEEKQKAMEKMAATFINQETVEFKDRELEKTAEELEAIDLANQITNEILQEYGKEPFDIPPKNIVVIPDDGQAVPSGNARYGPEEQAIVMTRSSSRTMTLHRLVHEMLHFKGYNAAELKEGRPKDYRSGLHQASRKDGQQYLVNINEAVIEELTRMKIQRLLEIRFPFLAAEADQTADILRHNAALPEAKRNEKLSSDTIFAAKTPLSDNPDALAVVNVAYPEPRASLWKLIQKVVERNKEGITEPQEVFDLFAIAVINGNMLPLGKLIDGTFGRGTLRKIAERGEFKKSLDYFIETL